MRASKSATTSERSLSHYVKVSMRRKRIWKYFKRTLLLLPAIYLFLWLFPQTLFAYSRQFRNLTLYSRSPLPENADDILKKTDGLLSSSELYSTNTPRHIFVCDGYKLYWLLTFGQRHSFGCSFGATSKNVFIPKADFANDLVSQEKWNAADSRKRNLSAVMAHEITHVMIAEYLGRVFCWRLREKAAWLDEGYCDFIARSSSNSLEDSVRSVLETPYDTKGLSYFRCRLMVAGLLNEKHLSIKTLLANPPDGQKVSDEITEKLRKNPVVDPASIEPNS